jgi:hypothetical protein
MANPIMIAKLKKVQAIAKKLRKDKPKLTHIEAVKLAWKQIPKSKSTIGAAKKIKPKKVTTKIATKSISTKIGSVKKNKPLILFCYDVILKNPDTDKIIFKKRIEVKRQNQKSAKEFLIKKFPKPYFLELYSSKVI